MKCFALTVGNKIVMNRMLDCNGNRINQFCIHKTFEEANANSMYGWKIREVKITIKPLRRKK